jgi:hypothetical protein
LPHRRRDWARPSSCSPATRAPGLGSPLVSLAGHARAAPGPQANPKAAVASTTLFQGGASKTKQNREDLRALILLCCAQMFAERAAISACAAEGREPSVRPARAAEAR